MVDVIVDFRNINYVKAGIGLIGMKFGTEITAINLSAQIYQSRAMQKDILEVIAKDYKLNMALYNKTNDKIYHERAIQNMNLFAEIYNKLYV